MTGLYQLLRRKQKMATCEKCLAYPKTNHLRAEGPSHTAGHNAVNGDERETLWRPSSSTVIKRKADYLINIGHFF